MKFFVDDDEGERKKNRGVKVSVVYLKQNNTSMKSNRFHACVCVCVCEVLEKKSRRYILLTEHEYLQDNQLFEQEKKLTD